MISCPLTLYWLPSSSVSGQVSQTQTSPFDMSGKSCGTVGMVSAAGMEFSRDGVAGSEMRCSWRASARVHFAVKSSSGAKASCVCTVGSGPGCRSSGAATAPAVPVKNVATSAPAVTIPPMSGRLMRRVDVDIVRRLSVGERTDCCRVARAFEVPRARRMQPASDGRASAVGEQVPG